MEEYLKETTKPSLKRSYEEMDATVVDNELMDVDATFIPTNYESKVFEVAMRRNTIAILEDGGERTIIAAMMIKELGESLKHNVFEKKLIVFLAPTVHRVRQQYKEIKKHVKFEVEEYYGAKGVDDWDAETWAKELLKLDVLVMTPQILLDALRKAYMSFETFCFIILDECHCASGNHPYTKIMKEFYHNCTNRPKVFGMTTSPVFKKGGSSIKDSENKILELQTLLDSWIYTIEDKLEPEGFVPSPIETCRFYEPMLSPPATIKQKLESSLSKFDAVLLDIQKSTNDYNGTECKMLRERLENDHVKILYCLENLGFVCAYEAVKVCMENTAGVGEEFGLQRLSIIHYEKFLEEALLTIGESYKEDDMKFLDVVNSASNVLDLGLISSKVHELLEIFRSFRKATELFCIVFVKKIIAAKVIGRVIKKLPDLSHVNISYLTGNNSAVGLSPKTQNEIPGSLRSGEVNLLFSTDAVEEGINVPKCSYVICFDLPETISSYVQAWGQALQRDCQYIIMLERGNNKKIDCVSKATKSEIFTAHASKNRNVYDCAIKVCTTNEAAAYVVKETGVSVTIDSSISLIHSYCEKLPRDKYFIPEPKFEFLQEGNLYRCKLVLPPNAAFQNIVGPEALDSHLSKKLVCLDACKKLHVMGDLNDHLLPVNEWPSQADSKSSVKVLTSGAGTTKRKELHGSVGIHLFFGTWADKCAGVIFHGYKMDFSCSIAEEKFSSFVLLLESKLDEDVGNIEVELYLRSKLVRSSVSFFCCLDLDDKQVAKAKCFQELMFNSLFGRMFVKSSGKREFLLDTKESLWNSSNLYLLLPLEYVDKASQEYSRIDWVGIESCVSAVAYLRKNPWLNFPQSEVVDRNSSVHMKDLVSTKTGSNAIQLADRSASIDNLKGMVVVAIHTARIYSILEAVEDMSAASPFEGDLDSKYLSFADYYKQKYKIVLKYPEQPLLLLKQSHNAHNLLVDFRNQGTFGKHKQKGGSKSIIQKPQQHVQIPPELLVGTDIRIDVLKSFYLLPSLMHRMESLMLASQLRKEISCPTVNTKIPCSLILESLTTLRCIEPFSMERLEFLGDSVLKYLVSCHLFLKYPKKHEGQLSSRRSSIVCNSYLHKLGTNHKLQEYIRDCAFDPRQWTAPGQRSVWSSPCDHWMDTMEVPLGEKFATEDEKVMVGKTCDRGHRWMISKTISDCVEGLIGAYYVGGGLIAALHLMKWLGIEAELMTSLIDDAIKVASLYAYAPQMNNINILESKINYKFAVKGLLLEAITHATEGVEYCYQRLEFLGDSVLDILITLHLYENHRDIDPGELTDLRSASVNNDNFATAAVRHNLHPHLLHDSRFLRDQISSFVTTVSSMRNTTLTPDVKAPKVLGDLVESIVGAILIDSKLDLDEVWKIFKPLLSPIVTPDKLELPPSRELIELCDSLGYFVKENYTTEGDLVHAELALQLEDALLIGLGSGPNRKAARGMASICLRKKLETRGIASSKRRNEATNYVDLLSSKGSDGSINCSANSENSYFQSGNKMSTQLLPQIPNDQLSQKPAEDSSDFKKFSIPVIPPINMKKGGPRTSLYDLCKKLQWPLPSFDTMEQKSRTPIQFGDTKGFVSFESMISLTIPNFGIIKLTGEARADKKSSFDSAAFLMMYELEKQGKIIISE